jgi:hypothetical protein
MRGGWFSAVEWAENGLGRGIERDGICWGCVGQISGGVSGLGR